MSHKLYLTWVPPKFGKNLSTFLNTGLHLLASGLLAWADQFELTKQAKETAVLCHLFIDFNGPLFLIIDINNIGPLILLILAIY